MKLIERKSRTGISAVVRNAAVLVAALGLIATACSRSARVIPENAITPEASVSSASGTATDEPAGTLQVAIVGNPQMRDIAELTPTLFTEKTGIEVEYTILEEGTLRQILSRDSASGEIDFDVVMIGMYEAPLFGADASLYNLTPFAEADDSYDLDDLIPTVRRGLSVGPNLYASPFYGESSVLMYRKDVLADAGISLPKNPTWQQVAEAARAVDTDEMAGICLRGKPGWGELGAVFTTVLNTFGGTWWLSNPDGSIGAAQVDSPEFREALEFYTGLVADAGPSNPSAVGYTECLDLYRNGGAAMWYDATVSASTLEADDSPVKRLNGYALAPTYKTDTSGWLWAWALAIPASNPEPQMAWDFISWATGPDYIAQAGELVPGGWAAIPPGTRASTYAIPQYEEASASFASITLEAMDAAPITNPGTTPRPGLPGVQYVGVPEFQELGNQCSELFAAVMMGERSLDDAIDRCQDVAATFSK